MDLTPMLVVKDVAASSEWYRRLLELESAHGGDEFEMLMGEGRRFRRSMTVMSQS